MLKVNNIEYNTKLYVDFDPFEGKINGKKTKCDVLSITCLTENFKLYIYTSYSIRWIKELKINDIKDISKYINDVRYEDENEWMSLPNECSCLICKINDKTINVILKANLKEYNKELDIKLDCNFEI